MIALLSTPKQRIVAAIATSLILHALLLWLPRIELPSAQPELPPLMAQLQTVERAPKVAKPKAARKKKTVAAPVTTPAAPVTPVPDAPELVAASAVAVASEVIPSETLEEVASAVVAASSVAEAPVVAPASPLRPPLPKHAQLKFEVRLGSDGIVVGETRHTLDFEDDKYVLISTTKTIGLARLVKAFNLNQTSYGVSDGQLLFPRKYTEEKSDDSKKEFYSATFNQATQMLEFDNAPAVALAPNVQDMLSILYQFPPLPAAGDVLAVAVTNGRNLERFNFEITTDEILNTRMGKLHTVHFRKLQAPGKEGLEIWFAQEYRLLPVKVRHIEASGKIGGEAIITEIRVSDK